MLLETVDEAQILVEKDVPTFAYFVNDIRHEYVPDVLVGNVIYDVKSWHTMKLDPDYELKRAAVLTGGYKHHCYVFETKTKYFLFAMHPDWTGRTYLPPEDRPPDN